MNFIETYQKIVINKWKKLRIQRKNIIAIKMLSPIILIRRTCITKHKLRLIRILTVLISLKSNFFLQTYQKTLHTSITY